MEISKRELAKEELDKIYQDFREIEKKYEIPEENSRRLNVTVEENGNVIGFASGLTNRKWFVLTDLWVHENYRRQGFGAKILRVLEEDAKQLGMENIYTWTTGYDKNDIFYEKQGYKKFTVFEDFFAEGGDHIGLRKHL